MIFNKVKELKEQGKQIGIMDVQNVRPISDHLRGLRCLSSFQKRIKTTIHTTKQHTQEIAQK